MSAGDAGGVDDATATAADGDGEGDGGALVTTGATGGGGGALDGGGAAAAAVRVGDGLAVGEVWDAVGVGLAEGCNDGSGSPPVGEGDGGLAASAASGVSQPPRVPERTPASATVTTPTRRTGPGYGLAPPHRPDDAASTASATTPAVELRSTVGPSR